jgi:purine-nucleoside phosphorylase
MAINQVLNVLMTPGVQKMVRTVTKRLGGKPSLAVVLGSGFSSIAAALNPQAELAYSEIPGFPIPSVPGHAGKLLLCQSGAFDFLVFSGRCHFYEGRTMAEVGLPVRLAHGLGVRDLVLTNAAGGINRRYRPGQLVVLKDHINLMGVNPLRGNGVADESPFVDMTQAYDPVLRSRFKRAAKQADIKVAEGIYLAVSGPSYETPAEIQAFARMGADLVGMSTVPEVCLARALDMRVAALSCVTNFAAGLSRGRISHQEVLGCLRETTGQAAELLNGFLRLCASAD